MADNVEKFTVLPPIGLVSESCTCAVTVAKLVPSEGTAYGSCTTEITGTTVGHTTVFTPLNSFSTLAVEVSRFVFVSVIVLATPAPPI